MSTDEWADGYKAGNAGLRQAIETAEQIATMRERKRIIDLMESREKHFYEYTVVNDEIIKTHSPVCHLCHRIRVIRGEI